MKEIQLLNKKEREEELQLLRWYMQGYIEAEWPENNTNYITMSDQKLTDVAILHTLRFFKEQLKYVDTKTYTEIETRETLKNKYIDSKSLQ